MATSKSTNIPVSIGKSVEAKTKAPKPVAKIAATNRSRLDGGFASSMHQPGAMVHPISQPKVDTPTPPPVPKAAEVNPTTDAVYRDDADFYSSKFKKPQPDGDIKDSVVSPDVVASHTAEPKSEGVPTKSRRPQAANYIQLVFIVLLFFATLLASYMVIYQPDQPPQGLTTLFEWLQGK